MYPGSFTCEISNQVWQILRSKTSGIKVPHQLVFKRHVMMLPKQQTQPLPEIASMFILWTVLLQCKIQVHSTSPSRNDVSGCSAKAPVSSLNWQGNNMESWLKLKPRSNGESFTRHLILTCSNFLSWTIVIQHIHRMLGETICWVYKKNPGHSKCSNRQRHLFN